MSRLMRLLVSIFVVLIGITLWLLIDKEPPTLVKPVNTIPSKSSSNRQLIAYGDSLTAWYQLSPEQSFPAQLQALFTQENIDITVINAGKSGDTSAQMYERLDRSLDSTASGDIFLFIAWGNDGLQWLPLDQLEKNIRTIIQKAKQRWLVVILWWMKLPPNYGSVYTKEFEALYPLLAQEEQVLFIPFILEGVATISELNLPDGIHPNQAGYGVIAKNVFTFLRESWAL